MNQVVPMKEQSNINEVSYALMEKVLAQGDLAQLTSKERVMFYKQVCESLNLNPLTQPFEFIKFDGKMAFYAKRSCAEQLRNLHTISVIKVEKEMLDGLFIYTAYIRKANGQEDVGTGAVSVKGLQGKALANAIKIAETQAKRRATLSICGLGWTDESEIQDIPNAQPLKMDIETGEFLDEQQKPHEPALEYRNELRDKIKNADNMVDLKNAYAAAYAAHMGKLDAMKDLTALKDERKEYLEACNPEPDIREIDEGQEAAYDYNGQLLEDDARG